MPESPLLEWVLYDGRFLSDEDAASVYYCLGQKTESAALAEIKEDDASYGEAYLVGYTLTDPAKEVCVYHVSVDNVISRVR